MDFGEFVLQFPFRFNTNRGDYCFINLFLIAIAISLKTLKTKLQNDRKLSTCPYIGIYIASTYIRDVSCYLVVKILVKVPLQFVLLLTILI